MTQSLVIKRLTTPKVTKSKIHRRKQYMGNVSFDKNMTQISFGFVHFAHFAFKYKL